jgi:NADPH2:quinone reductase
VYDSVGKGTFEQSLACLKPRGTLVLYGSAGGDVPPLDLIRLATLGSLYVTRPILRDYTLAREELVMRATEVFHTVATGKLHFRIEKTYSLEEAAQAHWDLATRVTTGKLLLIPERGRSYRITSFSDFATKQKPATWATDNEPLRHFTTP